MSGALVVCEALVDVVVRSDGTVSEHPGGSPLNVAIGLARLERETHLLTRLGQDQPGRSCSITWRDPACGWWRDPSCRWPPPPRQPPRHRTARRPTSSIWPGNTARRRCRPRRSRSTPGRSAPSWSLGRRQWCRSCTTTGTGPPSATTPTLARCSWGEPPTSAVGSGSWSPAATWSRSATRTPPGSLRTSRPRNWPRAGWPRSFGRRPHQRGHRHAGPVPGPPRPGANAARGRRRRGRRR